MKKACGSRCWLSAKMCTGKTAQGRSEVREFAHLGCAMHCAKGNLYALFHNINNLPHSKPKKTCSTTGVLI